MLEAAHKEQLKREVKAIRVRRSRNDNIPPQAFFFHTEVPHVPVEDGIRIVGEAAWSCGWLQAVHLPETVASLLHGAFGRCQVLRVVTAPSCKHFRLLFTCQCNECQRLCQRPSLAPLRAESRGTSCHAPHLRFTSLSPQKCRAGVFRFDRPRCGNGSCPSR